MAASLATAPPALALNGDDIWIEIQTDLVDTASAANFEITVSLPGPLLGQDVTFVWGGSEMEFTVEATENDLATAIPVIGVGETLDDYTLRIAEVFRQNGPMSSDFLVSVTGGIITLTSRTEGVLVLSVSGTVDSNFATVATDGTDPNTEVNLAAQVEIWEAGETFNDDQIITRLHATYDTSTAATEINLSELFPVSPHLPNPAHIDPGIFFSWLKGTATDSFIKYYLRYADKYGAPAIPEALVKSDEYFVIHGANSADKTAALSISFWTTLLHNYIRKDGGTWWKPIADGQPDWIYLWMKVDAIDCNVEWTITWDDGTETLEVYAGTPFDLDTHKAYYIRSTPLNFNFTPPSPGAIPWYITFRLKGFVEGETTLATTKYKAVIGTKWERFLLFDNGVGGCESVLFNGKGTESFSAKRDVARRVRSSDFNIDSGELITLNAEGQKYFELNTGWIESWYAEHLRQLLLGDVWIVDFEEERFIKLICDTESIETSQNDQQLFALSIKFKVAWMDKSSNQ